jgi:hypothetical protein
VRECDMASDWEAQVPLGLLCRISQGIESLKVPSSGFCLGEDRVLFSLTFGTAMLDFSEA